ncbi:MAG: NAD(P)H-dependent oxidoreductase subunit E [Betaproteobacteria bacterium]|nr:NAD(P)H-dependent oxidoreductase subunit E [Betaproteobacteria bacterium]
MNDRATASIPLADVRRKMKARNTPKGRQVDPAARADVAALLAGRESRRDLLIEFLHLVQDRFNQLSAAHLAALAEAMKLSQAEVYEVATFYHHFDVVKEGESAPPALTVRVCETLSCTMAGAGELLEKLPALLGKDVRVIAAPCIGRCAEAPAVCVGQNAFGFASVDLVVAAVHQGATSATPSPPVPPPRGGREASRESGSASPDKASLPLREKGGREGAPHIDFATYQAQAGYQTWLEVASGKRDAESILKALENSNLRGLGGAGFPAGRKWRIVRAEPAPRLMAVNIDEGEPGTFKDRHYLERDPHRFLEGLLIAAKVVGIDACYIYLRDEYHQCRALLEAELAALQAGPPGGVALPHIELRRGAGAYICGEESAMIESIEGHRGMPRLRPPYVAQVGLFGRPTLEHNMETLYWVRDILEKGADWFAGHGRNGRKGLRSFSVSGRVKKPGVHLAPAGITVRELIEEFCGGMQDGHAFYAYLPGGASGGILPASMGDIPLDFDTLQPHGCFIGSAAVVILSDQDKARDAALNLMKFFADESCGQCTPCRVGTEKAVRLLEESKWKTGLLEELSQVMVDASICGLGQAAPNPIRCVIKHFPHEIA